MNIFDKIINFFKKDKKLTNLQDIINKIIVKNENNVYFVEITGLNIKELDILTNAIIEKGFDSFQNYIRDNINNKIAIEKKERRLEKLEKLKKLNENQ